MKDKLFEGIALLTTVSLMMAVVSFALSIPALVVVLILHLIGVI